MYRDWVIICLPITAIANTRGPLFAENSEVSEAPGPDGVTSLLWICRGRRALQSRDAHSWLPYQREAGRGVPLHSLV